MARRLSFLAITLFWVTMNILLWRMEFRTDADGAGLPPRVVWRRILTAPDDSGLAINLAGSKVGFVRWIPNAGEEIATGKISSENEVEGRVTTLTNFTLHAEGNVLLPDTPGRIRFEFDARFGSDHRWREWDLTVAQRPNQWRIMADKEKDRVELRVGAGREPWVQAMKLSDFQNPRKLLDDSGLTAALPLAAAMIPGLDPSAFSEIPTNAPPVALGLNWTARQDWMKIGSSRIRVYRLEAQLLDEYKAVVLISRVGEILQVELPGDLVLLNESFINF